MKSFALAALVAITAAQEEGGGGGMGPPVACETSAECMADECCAMTKDETLGCIKLTPPEDAPEDSPAPMCIED